MTTEAQDSKLHCLLIGINHYLPNHLPNGLYYKSLWGCVSDIDRIQGFLQHSLGVPDAQIVRLTSSKSPDGETSLESPDHWPTYDNIVKAFESLTQNAEAGDQVYIHYSGHGGRTLTTDSFKPIKGEQGLDEVLVPMDLGNSEGHYLRDTELHYLITRMVEKGILVTVVLDSCHSGGATRNTTIDNEKGAAGVRGAGVIDTLPRAQDSLVASDAELTAAWQLKPNTRNVESKAGWLLEPNGYTLIAACRANEYANEIVFEGSEKNGALSYWLVDSLKQIGSTFTYAKLHNRLLTKVHGHFIEQTPLLEGEGDRVVFGLTNHYRSHSIPILRIIDGDRIVLNAGLAQGVHEGSQFAIYPFGEADLTNTASRLAVASITKVSATESEATLLEKTAEVAVDSQAVLLDAGTIKLRGKIRLVNAENSSTEQAEALQRVAPLLSTQTSGATISLAAETDTPDYVVTIRSNEYVICDASGSEVPNLLPPLQISEPDAARRVFERLSHLVKFMNVYELDNNEPLSAISRKLSVELVEKPSNFVPGEPVKLQPFSSLGQNISLAHNEWALLRIRNDYSAALNVTVLDLQPDWGISQIYPGRAASFETIDPGQSIVLPMLVKLPEGLEFGRDTIKVFATLSTTDFHCLELPPLDGPQPVRTLIRSSSLDGLEAFLHNFSQPGAIRTVEIPVCATVEWCAHQVEIEIKGKTLSVTAG